MERSKYLLTPEKAPSVDQKNDMSKPSLVNHCVYYNYLPVYGWGFTWSLTQLYHQMPTPIWMMTVISCILKGLCLVCRQLNQLKSLFFPPHIADNVTLSRGLVSVLISGTSWDWWIFLTSYALSLYCLNPNSFSSLSRVLWFRKKITKH